MQSTKVLLSIVLAGTAAATVQGCGASAKKGSVRPPAPVIVADAATNAPRGSLLQAPVRVDSLDPVGFKARALTFGDYGSLVGEITGPLLCGIDVYHFKYSTVGAANEPATASGAIMVPTGGRSECNGARPMVLYAHGNTRYLSANMANMNVDATLGHTALMAASLYASQGYVVVAPNYAGYDTSNLGYHPHHLADQQSKDMYDALSAARAALPGFSPSVAQNGKLFITGYSEGGYATMATHRALQAAGIPVTASSPQAGNYAESVGLERQMSPGAFNNFSGVNLDDMVRLISKFTGWQKAYGNIYTTPSDVYPAAYAAGMESISPSQLSNNQLKAKLPPFYLANDMPHYSGLSAEQKAFYGTPEQSLLKTSYIVKIQEDVAARPCPVLSAKAPLDCAPTHPARQAWLKNDLRTWVPTSPMLMCHGLQDPVVGSHNTTLTKAYFDANGVQAGMVSVVDVSSAAEPGDPYAVPKETFATLMHNIARAGQDPLTGPNYHGFMAFVACAGAGRDFFRQF